MTTRLRSCIYKKWFSILLLILIGGSLYLPNMGELGYYRDDWNNLFNADSRGTEMLIEHYASDRPADGYLLSAAYRAFGADPFPYRLVNLAFRVLEDDPHLRVQFLKGDLPDIPARNETGTLQRSLQSAQNPDERRFSGAVVPQNGNPLPWTDIQGYPVQDPPRPVVGKDDRAQGEEGCVFRRAQGTGKALGYLSMS